MPRNGNARRSVHRPMRVFGVHNAAPDHRCATSTTTVDHHYHDNDDDDADHHHGSADHDNFTKCHDSDVDQHTFDRLTIDIDDTRKRRVILRCRKHNRAVKQHNVGIHDAAADTVFAVRVPMLPE